MTDEDKEWGIVDEDRISKDKGYGAGVKEARKAIGSSRFGKGYWEGAKDAFREAYGEDWQEHFEKWKQEQE